MLGIVTIITENKGTNSNRSIKKKKKFLEKFDSISRIYQIFKTF